MIEVLEQIKPILKFESKDDFYYLQIIQRNKDNTDLKKSSRVIKNYYISSIEYLEAKYPEIKSLCELFKARAMLRLNKRSYTKVGFRTMQYVADNLSKGDHHAIKKCYDKAVGNGHDDPNKKWIVDIDGNVDEDWLKELTDFINSQNPTGEKIIMKLPTKNGIHLITSPFDLREFKNKYQLDVHKDNPINLYIPAT